MDEHHKQDDFLDNRLLSVGERECVRAIDGEEDLVERLQEQRQEALQKLWASFQVAASSLAQLYKERPSCDCCERCLYKQNNHDRWQPFQGAANKVTLLYRDGSEALRAGMELGYNAGYQKRNRDLTNWAKKKRKLIRREDLLCNLSGRSPPRRKQVSSPKPPTSPTRADFLTNLNDCSELDLNSLMESAVNGRNPFLNNGSNNNCFDTSGRKRHNDVNMLESPHKRSRFS